MTAGEFLRKRLVRIVPLYWVATVFMLAVMLAAPSLIKTSRFESWHALASLLFVGAPNPGAHGIFTPLVSVGWTLNLEMLFYAIFAIAIRLSSGKTARFLLTVAVPMLVLSVADLFVRDRSIVGFYCNSIMLEFVVGTLIGAAFLSGRLSWPWWFSAALALVALAVMLVPPVIAIEARAARFGLPAAALVLAAVAAPLPRIRILHLIGDSSYSLYLSHFFVLSAFTQVWKHLGIKGEGPAQHLVFYLASLSLAVMVGYLCWRWIERPLTAWAGGLRGATQPNLRLSLFRSRSN